MSTRQPFFAGLVYNEEGQPVQVAQVGDEPCYAIPDGDFLRHVEAITVDRQAIALLKERLMPLKDALVEGVLQMTGSGDPFSRAAVEMGLENMERLLEPGVSPPEDMRLALWMSGFRIIVNVHGEVVRVEVPGLEEGE
jgi:hypothetical protein